MKKRFSKVFVSMIMALAMVLSLFGTVMAAETDTTVVSESAASGELYAGAGAEAIHFETAMFTDYGNVEGFSGEVESDPYIRALIVEDGEKSAIIQCELVNVPSDVIAWIQEYTEQVAGVPAENVWVHANHTITTPHAPSDETARAMYVEAVETAAAAAINEAVQTFQPAKMGVSVGESYTNKNRNQLYDDGAYHVGSDGVADEARGIISNPEATVVSFQGNDGNVIGMLFSYGVKPTTIDNAEMSEGTRKISSDLTGLACTMMEAEFGAPCMFIMGASGDQCATRETNYFELNEETGKYESKFESVETGIAYVKEYGTQLGNDIIAIAKTIEYTYESAPVKLSTSGYTWDNNKGDGQVSVDIWGMAFGDDVAFVGLKPEVDAQTERELWDASEYKYTMMASFVNGDQKYMPHAAAYEDPKTVEGQKSGFAVGAAEEYVAVAADMLNAMKYNLTLYAGAGAAAVKFPTAMFTDYGNVEGFSGEVESDPYIRVILLEDGVKAAIVQCELVNVPSDVIASIKEYVYETTGTAKSRVWVHANHTITTPHAPSDETARAMYVDAVMAAAEAATDAAAATFQRATMVVATGESYTNNNRNQLYGDGAYHVGSDGVEDASRGIISNPEATLITFKGLDGEIIGMAYSYGVKPTTIDNAEMSAGTRKISSDLTGLACRMMEEEFDAPCMFIMGASGDQCATRETNYFELNEETGKYESKFESVETGIAYVKEYGTQLGNDLLKIAYSNVYEEYTSAPIVVASTTFTWDNNKGDGTVDVDVYGMTLGDDVAFIGLKPEVDAQTERELWAASDYKYTMMASFMNGDQKYMPHAAAYDDPKTVEGQKSGFAVGAAEEYVATAAGLLSGIRSGEIVNVDDKEEKEEEYKEYSTVTVGGIEWYVIATEGNQSLLLSKDVLEKKAFNDEETAVTWETCTLRAYLNGEFYDSLSDTAKAKIVEVTNTTKASSYGISGGNDTQDKVFILSVEEAEKYVVNSNAAIGYDADGNAAWWSLRNLGEAVDVQTDVKVDGTIDYHGPSNGVANADAGVRPAIWVDNSVVTADDLIKSVTAYGFVDADGAKTSAIIVEYADEIVTRGTDLTADDFEIEVYDTLNNSSVELGGDLGKITKVYINDKPEPAVTAASRGNYVIIEVNTDYQRGSVPKYTSAMAIGVKQVGTLTNLSGVSVLPGDWVRNYTVTESTRNGSVSYTYTAEEGTYAIVNVSGYQLYTKEDGTAFHATNCFEEATGEYIDVDLPYALYVPEDYDPNGNYGLVLQIHDAGTMGDDPMLTLTESQACANYASAEVQQMAKDNGMDGLIVVAPMINNDLRSTRDNYTMSAAVPATWQLLDYITDTYAVNMDRIFGTGQSMGGMQVIAMAAQRDNYFAGIWEHGCQWGSNYAKDEPYPERGGGYGYYYMSKDDTIWRTDADGNDSDYGQNFYYLISDDNVLISNCQGDAFSSTVWQEVAYLYEDIAGVEIPYTAFNPLTDSLDDQNAAIEELVATENDGFGMYWYAYSGGSHMLTWIYGQKLDAGYEWLISQTRESEQERSKLTELANDWAAETDPEVIAEKQHQIGTSDYYFAVPAEGAGTKGYNAGWFGMQGTPADDYHTPGWVQIKIVGDGEGHYFYYEGGKINTEKYGFVTYDGAEFLVANGMVARNINGLAQDPENPEDWYYVAAGQVVDYTGMIEYDGAWFYVEDGMVDTTYSGLCEYDGATFIIAAGRLASEANGFAKMPNGDWVYAAAGQVQTQYTGLVLYDGAWFYVENGVYSASYTGTVVYDGATFEVENGMLKIAGATGFRKLF